MFENEAWLAAFPVKGSGTPAISGWLGSSTSLVIAIRWWIRMPPGKIITSRVVASIPTPRRRRVELEDSAIAHVLIELRGPRQQDAVRRLASGLLGTITRTYWARSVLASEADGIAPNTIPFAVSRPRCSPCPRDEHPGSAARLAPCIVRGWGALVTLQPWGGLLLGPGAVATVLATAEDGAPERAGCERVEVGARGASVGLPLRCTMGNCVGKDGDMEHEIAASGVLQRQRACRLLPRDQRTPRATLGVTAMSGGTWPIPLSATWSCGSSGSLLCTVSVAGAVRPCWGGT